MLGILGEEVMALITKEIIKHAPEIQDAIIKELEHVSSVLWKYATDAIDGQLEGKK